MLGRVIDKRMHLSSIGQVVADEWLKTGIVRQNVTLDEWILMPDHFHAVLCLAWPPRLDDDYVWVSEGFGCPVPGSLSSIMRSFKSATTRKTNELRNTPGGKLWQGRFWDRIIRDGYELCRIRTYIRNNPRAWRG